MDEFQQNFGFSYKVMRFHFFLHFISFAFCSLNYIYLLNYTQRYFFAIFLTFQILLLIFLLQILCLLKIFYFNYLTQLKCTLNLYAMISLIFLVLIIIQFILIFEVFDMYNKYKIILLSFGLLYYAFDGFIFLYEISIINKQIRKTINQRILMQMQNRNDENNIAKHDTQTSDKTNKNQTFVKEDTIYIINENNNENKNNTNNKNNIFTEINNTNSYVHNESNIITIKRNNKIKFVNNKFKTFNESKIKNNLDEEDSVKSYEFINIIPFKKKVKITKK